MKKFKFRLERVLRYRHTVLQEREKELLSRQNQLTQAENVLDELRKAQLEGVLEGDRTYLAQDLLQVAAYRAGLKILEERKILEIIDLEQEVAKARDAYIEAKQDEDSLVRLKERKHLEYTEYVNKESEKFLDELTVQRIGRRLRS